MLCNIYSAWMAGVMDVTLSLGFSYGTTKQPLFPKMATK
jgi:hypothetical protein